MNTALHQSLPGYGLAGAGDTAVSVGTPIAQAAATVALTHTAIGATVAAMLGTAAIPIVGAVIAGISLGIEAILHSGCGQTCIITSQWANQAEPYLQKNIAAYFQIAPPRPRSVQQVAVANFDAIWNTLVQQCSQPGLGGAGQNCINDRKSGACKWKAIGQPYPGTPAPGACWNWFNGYRDPIANDTQVYDDSIQSAAAGVTSAAASGGFDPTLLLIGAGVLGAFFLVSQL